MGPAVAQGVLHRVACLQGGAAAAAVAVEKMGSPPAMRDYESEVPGGIPTNDESGFASTAVRPRIGGRRDIRLGLTGNLATRPI